ncbi:hypothetical protein SAMN04489724_4234 [Algoriphagus locisalis]|uniref:Por secretion system C-terminal sorting domain-containing protein n=1 Tax=Algoriphagus locisalis TaxID=305507 RepID=A0A1I7DPD7_9BACT|nr:T9SS type A sorting domain-containing protein [Algoriphagus locisalis]SFU13486.1 hypothetical protein SAMN04489724_4234 [Algoriphagus locisalis]
MKTLLTVALASALSFSSFVASASEDLRALSAVNSNFKKINVTLNEGVGKAKISIMSTDGKVLNNRNVRVKGETLMLPYNMESLPTGEYLVKIVTEDEEVTYTVETSEKLTPATELPLMAYGKLIDSNTVNLSVFGLNEPGVDVEIISSANGTVLFTDHITQEEAFRKDYTFTKTNVKDIHLKVTDSQGRSKTLYF